MYPEIQKKCQTELDGIFEGAMRPAALDDLARMKYLESCIKESLRCIHQPFYIRLHTSKHNSQGNFTMRIIF